MPYAQQPAAGFALRRLMIAGFGLVLASSSGLPAASTVGNLTRAPEIQSSVICLEHLGESDKPILPLVIASAKLSRDDLKGLLGTPANPDHVKQFLFPEAEVRALGGQIARQLKQAPSTPATSGVVLVTVAGIPLGRQAAGEETEHEKINRSLSAEDARRTLELLYRFQPADPAAGNELKKAVATFKRRTLLD
jgi:hypothetical protein